MRKKKGFVDKGLYGLKDKLQKNTEETIEQQPDQTEIPHKEPAEENITIEKIKEPEIVNNIEVTETPISPVQEKPIKKPPQLEKKPELKTEEKIDKEFKKALQNRKNEYLRTKKHVVQKVTSTLNRLPLKMKDLEKELKDLSETEQRIKETIDDINDINENKWHNEDFSSQLGEASKTVENARLQHLLISSKLSNLEDDGKNKLSTNGDNSIIPELTSLKFIQLFTLGLGFTLPLIIGFIATGIIISLTIFFVMGGF
jgi:chromosome segregation ATPase